jgi:hypothetical protein
MIGFLSLWFGIDEGKPPDLAELGWKLRFSETICCRKTLKGFPGLGCLEVQKSKTVEYLHQDHCVLWTLEMCFHLDLAFPEDYFALSLLRLKALDMSIHDSLFGNLKNYQRPQDRSHLDSSVLTVAYRSHFIAL